jgi:nucleoside-diphosphate-sugar epimerase
LIAAQRKGRLKIIGKGLNKVDFTSVQNLNDALFAALLAGGPALGQAYNISNGQPRRCGTWSTTCCAVSNCRRSANTCHTPWPGLAALNEGFCYLRPGRPEPTMTRLGMAVMPRISASISAAPRRLLGYEPRASLWDALDEFCEWWQRSGLLSARRASAAQWAE